VTGLFNQNPYSLRLSSFEPDNFSVLGFTTENFSFDQDYSCTVSFRLFHKISLQECLLQPACLVWENNSLSGIVSKISESNVVVVSPLYLLNLKKHSRVYADVSFELLKIILTKNSLKYKLDFSFLLNNSYPVLKYIAQYQETDLEFIQRQCSRWGIFFGFMQHANKAVLVFCDNSLSFAKQFPEVEIEFEKFSQYKKTRKLYPKVIKLKDYNPDAVELDLEMEASSVLSIPSQGIDNRLYEFYQTRELGEFLLKRRMEYYDARRETVLAETGNVNLQLGQAIKIKDNFYIADIKLHVDILKNIKRVDLILIPQERLYRPALPTLFHMPDCTGYIISESVNKEGRYYISPDYDENKANNTYPVRLAQPSTGENSGFHFPLIKHTKVYVTHINGDPDRPVIVGVFPGEEAPTLVTSENNSQHILKTPAGNQWLMDDDEVQPQLKFNSASNQAVLSFLKDQIVFKADKDISIKSNQLIAQSAERSYVQEGGENYRIVVKNNYEVNTGQYDLNMSSGKNLTLSSKSTAVNYKNINLESHESLSVVSGGEVKFKANNTDIKSEDNINLNSRLIKLSAHKKIILSVGSSSLVINSAEISINAKAVNFNGAFVSPPPQLGASASQSIKSQFNSSGFELEYINLENRSAAYMIYSGKELLYSGSVRNNNSINNIDVSQKLTISHSGLPVISVEDKLQKPGGDYALQAVLHKRHKIKLLKSPVYKKAVKTQNNFQCELLSEKELDYFKKYKNTITVFIHGYDIQDGHFGEYSYIRTPQEGFPDDDVNGSGAHNWLLHMEYNLNCAVQNTYLEFPWENKAEDYKRVLGYHWPGYQRIFDVPYSDNLNFAGMEFNAIGAGYALIALIKKFKSAGLTINIIAHSLGCLVAVQVMDLLGRNHQKFINNVILWEPAISATALSPNVIDSVEQRRKAVSETVEGEAGSLAFPPLMLYEYYGEFLRQKAGQFKHIPPWDLYEKDPFAYFPYAHIAAQKIHVFSSEYDDTLKYAYQANAVFAGLPHLNFIHHPMGLHGPDSETLKLLKSTLTHTDQKNWLLGHSEMKIPTKILFENIYTLIIKELEDL
jgi:uncharacterized protein involved in type VI secretion and phage assembly